jgi:hypothetical protein
MRTRTQTDRIICHLATGRPLTPLAALKRFGCFRLGARIYDLKKQGHSIAKRMVKRGGTQVAEYRLQH